MFKNICWVQRLFALMIFGLFILSLSSLLSGCGNKGDLYLPDSSSKASGSIDKSSIKSDSKNNTDTNSLKKKS